MNPESRTEYGEFLVRAMIWGDFKELSLNWDACEILDYWHEKAALFRTALSK